jgi:predicted permease
VRDWTAFVRSQLALDRVIPEREARLVREIASQLEDFYQEALACGASEEEADAFARAQISDWAGLGRDLVQADPAFARPRLERLTERVPQLASPGRGALRVLADILTDARYAVRQLRKNRGFTTVAVLTLALGLGPTTAIFSVVNGVLLRPLPFPEPDRLVRVLEVVPKHGRLAVAPANFLDWRRQNTVFERMAAYSGGSDTFVGSDGPERLPMAWVSWDTFELLRVQPVLGRGFQAEEDAPNHHDKIVISHGMWQRRLGGDPGIVGRSIALGGRPLTIIGVMPPDFYFPSRQAEYWRPLAFNPVTASRSFHSLSVMARLKDGVSVEQAGAEMRTIAERLAAQHPQISGNESAQTIRMHDLLVGRVRPMLLTLLAAVAVVVLIACANVANLLLARGSVREREIAIRRAMGAGRSRIAMQMLVESLVLALAGGAGGVVLAYLWIGPLRTLSPIPRVGDVTLDGTVLAFSVAVSVLTGLIFGLAPAWQSARGLGSVLKDAGRSSVGGGGRWLRKALLVAEVALSIVLLIGAALLMRSFANVVNIDPGFRSDRILAFQVGVPRTSYPGPDEQLAFFDRLLARLRQTPGVESVGMSQDLPMRGTFALTFSVQGRAVAPGDEPTAQYRAVTRDYFQTLAIPPVRGRTFAEREPAPMVAVVDEAFAQRHFPEEDPIGRSIHIRNSRDGLYEIIGVVGEVRNAGLEAAAAPTIYVPFQQDVFSTTWVMVKTAEDPLQLAAAARLALRDVDPSLPAFAMTPLEDVVWQSVAERRFAMLLLVIFALVALFLAAVGLYGVVAYTVSQQTREIGLRMAMGAQRGDVLRMVLGGGMKLALIGVVLGMVGALSLAGLVASLLFGVTPFDPASYAGTAVLLLAVAAMACFVPARRAMRMDPLQALRHD